VAKLVPATCPKCGANVQLDPDREFVTCQFCGASSFVQTQKRPVTAYVHQHALPVIHVPRAVGILSGCSGAVALVGALIGVGAAVAAGVLGVVTSKSTSVVPSLVASPSPGSTPAEASTTEAPTAALVEEDYFADATRAKARYEKVLGKPIMAKQLSLMQYYATLEAQDPKNRDHVNSYKLWANQVERPQPVRLGGDKQQISQLVFSLDSIDFSVVPRVIKTALTDLKLEEGKVAVVVLERDGQGKREPIWRVIVNGSRDNGVVEFSITGEKLRTFQ
jgi:hypothetical protein